MSPSGDATMTCCATMGYLAKSVPNSHHCCTSHAPCSERDISEPWWYMICSHSVDPLLLPHTMKDKNNLAWVFLHTHWKAAYRFPSHRPGPNMVWADQAMADQLKITISQASSISSTQENPALRRRPPGNSHLAWVGMPCWLTVYVRIPPFPL